LYGHSIGPVWDSDRATVLRCPFCQHYVPKWRYGSLLSTYSVLIRKTWPLHQIYLRFPHIQTFSSEGFAILCGVLFRSPLDPPCAVSSFGENRPPPICHVVRFEELGLCLVLLGTYRNRRGWIRLSPLLLGRVFRWFFFPFDAGEEVSVGCGQMVWAEAFLSSRHFAMLLIRGSVAASHCFFLFAAWTGIFASNLFFDSAIAFQMAGAVRGISPLPSVLFESRSVSEKTSSDLGIVLLEGGCPHSFFVKRLFPRVRELGIFEGGLID